ncbi:MAG: radical SAM protein [Candidatus Cloacimonetes bacterium]|nr:radical SAM protein [Candidatus Cloacimonadota bacterium]
MKRNKPEATLIYPVFIPMQGCPMHCIYCDQYQITGEAEQDGADVAGAREFLLRNKGRKRQVAFYGGSFTALSQKHRERLIQPLWEALDGHCSLRISTHPLYIDEGILRWCKDWWINTIELGIQDFSDEVLAAVGRGYGFQDAKQAALMVKEHGFELGIQLMPGLPGWTMESIRHNHTAVRAIKPHLLRIYPCIVIKGTPLERMWQEGRYQALELEEALAQSADWQQLCDQEGIRLIKLGIPSNLAPSEITAGPWHPAFGQLVQAELLVRSLQRQYSPGSTILLDKNSWNLIVAHKGFYHKILMNRMPGCILVRQ